MDYSLEGSGSSTRQRLFASVASDEQFEHLDGQTVQQLDNEPFGTDAKFRSSLSISYAPSLGRTDFSEPFPYVVHEAEAPLSQDYSVSAVVGSAWNSLQSDTPKHLWEDDFWDKFLDPTVSAFEQLERGFKRPMPFHFESSTPAATTSEIDRRVSTKVFKDVPSFLKLIKDIPERSWQEEREAMWETSVRRWVALIDTWKADGNLLVMALQGKNTFTEKAQILVDVFFNKAPQTLAKRVNSMAKICSVLQSKGLAFPCSESCFYDVLKSEAQRGVAASSLKAYFEAVVFTRHVLGLESLQQLVDSRRCLGAASQKNLSCPRQANPFTVKQLRRFHEVLREDSELWNRLMAGMILFCTYSRARWSDAQHAEELEADVDSHGIVQHLEVKTHIHKTARALHLRHVFLPLSAPASGVTDDAWGAQWLEIRNKMCITDLKKFPLMPAPDINLEPTVRPVSTQETKQWIAHLLGTDVGQGRLTSHSCKCTCLSYLAKRGCSVEDRLMLGYHSNKMRMALTYSRDSIARPLALLSHVLSEIRNGVFEPDNSRSGRLHAGATPLDKMDFVMGSDGGPATGMEPGRGCQDVQDEVESTGSWQHVSFQKHAADEDPLEGHVTTDSSDSSDEENRISPVVGHYTVDIPEDKRLWLNQNSKMFHLSIVDHSRILLCGRRVSQSFRQHEGQVRYDSAKCRQCFRLKDS